MRVCRQLRSAACTVVFALSGASLRAQVIRGSVVLPDSVTPLAGAIVVASDSRRGAADAARALANARGEFVMRVPAPGRYATRVLRIGFRPTTGPVVDVGANDTVRVRIVSRGDAIVLSAVNVRDKETCRVGADSGMMVARVWDEARKAMLSSQLSSDDVPLVADWIEYDRMLDSSGHIVRAQHVKSATNPTTHAFRSLPAGQLADKGYVVSDNTGTTYYAPDADVLLSDSFASTHCFHLQAAPGDDHLIGVAFSPARSRRDALDIEGVLWVDRTTAELETLEFQYTNLPDLVHPAHPGGRVEFLRLSDGNWLVSRWSVRMPRVEALDRSPGTGMRRVIQSASSQALGGVQVTGGEVNRVMRHDTLVYRQTGPRIFVQVFARDSLMRPSRARLTLEGTDYAATADDNGRIELTPVLGGRYRGRVSTAFMDSLGMAPVEHEIEATSGARVDSVSHFQARATRCTPHVRAIRSATVKACCTAACATTGRETMCRRGGDDHVANRLLDRFEPWFRRDHARERTLGALTDDNGYWRSCGVPRDQALVVRAATDSGSDVQKMRLDRESGFRRRRPRAPRAGVERGARGVAAERRARAHDGVGRDRRDATRW